MTEKLYSLEKIEDFFSKYSAELTFEVPSKKASVLLPLIKVNNEVHILFEVRAQELKWQPGEICFPGGRVDETDETFKETAIRETIEELGLNRRDIKVYGDLDYIATQMGFIIYPYIGLIAENATITLSKDEVEKVFTVPLSFLLKATPREAELEVLTNPISDNFPYDCLPDYVKGPRRRKTYTLYFYEYENYVIWGITARILKCFLALYKKSIS